MVRHLGVDPGLRRVGLAVSDQTGTIATPLRVVDRKEQDLQEELRKAIDKNQVEHLVIGYPEPLKVDENERTKQVDNFIREIIDPLEVSYTIFSERYSSREAARLQEMRSQSDEVLDDEAAAVILQNYLESEKKNEN